MSDKPIAVVTGGASGIGEACARRFTAEGYDIAILDQSADAANAVAADLGGLALAVDVSDAGAVDRAIDEVVQNFSRVDALVCSAGILETPSTIMEADPEAHQRLWQVNYNGTLHCCQSVGRVMERQGSGAIVTLGSINSFVPLPLPAYCPSKTAILRLTEMLAVELGRFGVRVNGVAPTYVLTPAIKARIESGERDPAVIQGANALNMFVEPGHIADVVHFLCSDQAAAVSGVMLPVDAAHLAKAQYTGFAGGVPWQT
jgi:NAD(P)-dependent dehydrogenase (short-subunit alcohol dehydrogenase family)